MNVTSTLNNMGAAEQNLVSNYPAAIRYYLLSLHEAEKLNDTYQTANAADNISQIYVGQKNYKKALDYAFKALKLRKTLKDTIHVIAARELGNSMSSLGGIYAEMKDSARAGNYYLEAVRLQEKAGNREGQAKAYTSLAVLGKDVNKKLEYSLIAKKIWDEVNPAQIEAVHNLGNLGTCYLEMYQSGILPKGVASKKQLFDLSEKHLVAAVRLSKENGNIDFKNYFTGILADLQAEKGDYKSAYLNFRTFQAAQDSIFSQENKNRIAALEGERALAVRDKQIELNRIALEAQKKQQWALLAGLILLAIIGALLYWQSRTRKRTNVHLLHLNNELDEANQVKAFFLQSSATIFAARLPIWSIFLTCKKVPRT